MQLVGGDSEFFNRYLAEDDPCFGKYFAKTAEECQQCRAVVVVEGKLALLKEVCEARCRGDAISGGALLRLTARQVLDKLQAGSSPQELFSEVLNGCDPKAKGAAARQLLYDRFWYIRNELRLPTPDLPTLKELQ